MSSMDCMHGLFEKQASIRPSSIAAIYEDESFTYRELDERSNKLSHFLVAQGVGSEDLVALSMERSIEMVIAMLAVLKSGAAYLPLDPNGPKNRNLLIIESAGVKALISDNSSLVDFRGIKIDLGYCLEDIERQPTDSLNRYNADSLAYVIYTSGSTGQPKGVMIEHLSAVNTIVDVNSRWGIGPTDRTFFLSAATFDLSVYDIFGALSSGAAVVIPPQHATFDPLLCLELVTKHRVSIWNSVPALMELQLDAANVANSSLSPSLRLVLLSGDWIPLNLPARIKCEAEGVTVVGLGGATEASIWSNFYEIDDVLDGWTSIPYGRPLSNQDYYILDERGNAVKEGEPGYLYITGKGVARGYINQPDLTAERFVKDSYSEYSRMYNTGDMGRYMVDGNIEFLGRVDTQVKINGYRIELGEIESQVLKCDGVKRAIAKVERLDSGESKLVCFVSPSVAANLKLVIDCLKESLPSYMHPEEVIGLDEFPLTSNGKVDRSRLVRKDISKDLNSKKDNDDVITPSLSKLLEMCQEVSGEMKLSEREDFLLNSINAVKLSSRIFERFGVKVKFSELLKPMKALDLFNLVSTMGLSKDYIDVIKIKGAEKYLYPLSPAQEQIWFFEKFIPGNIAYQFQSLIEISGPLDLKVLTKSLQIIVDRHDAFRLFVLEDNGEPLQKLVNYKVDVPVVDLSILEERQKSEALNSLIEQKISQKIDPTVGPMVQWSAFCLDNDNHLLLHREHHLIHDGWSFRLFLKELAEVYTSIISGITPVSSKPKLRYVDYAQWHVDWVGSKDMQSQFEYWSENLKSYPGMLSLPYLSKEDNTEKLVGNMRRLKLEPELVQKLRKVSSDSGFTLFQFMFSAFSYVIHKYCCRSDIVIGVSNANRLNTQMEDVIGMFVSVLPIRLRLDKCEKVRDLLSLARETLDGAYENSLLPFVNIVEAASLDRNQGEQSLVQVAFSFHDSFTKEVNLPELKLSVTEGLSNGSAKFPINVIVIPSSNEELNTTEILIEYDTSMFSIEFIDTIASDYVCLLNYISDHDGQALDAPIESLLAEKDSGILGSREREGAMTSKFFEFVDATLKSVLPENYYDSEDKVLLKKLNSLQAIRFISRCNNDLGISLNFLDVVNCAEVDDFVDLLKV